MFVKVSWLANQFSLNCVKRMLTRNTRLCKTAPQCESYSIELFFTWWLVKVLALCLVFGQTQDSQLAESLKKLAFVIFQPQDYFSPKTYLKIWSGELKAMAIYVCRLNLGLSTIYVKYSALRNKKIFKWTKAKKLFGYEHIFSCTFLNIQFDKLPLRSCCSSDKFNNLVWN